MNRQIVLIVFSVIFLSACVTPREEDPVLSAPTRLYDALKNHPRKEINTDLISLVYQGKVVVRWNKKDIDRASATIITTMDQNGHAVLTISPYDNFSSVARQITFYHEYQHVRQILDKRYTFLFNAQLNSGNYTSKESLTQLGVEKYQTEFEGYAAACELSAELGEKPDLCKNYGTPQFRTDLAKFLLASSQVQSLPEPYQGYMTEGIMIAADS